METSTKVLLWAAEKGIDKPENIGKQAFKLLEEVDEFIKEIADNNGEKARMELGDCMVVLTILAAQLGTDTETCLALAYEKIKNRTGRTENGQFIKDK